MKKGIIESRMFGTHGPLELVAMLWVLFERPPAQWTDQERRRASAILGALQKKVPARKRGRKPHDDAKLVAAVYELRQSFPAKNETEIIQSMVRAGGNTEGWNATKIERTIKTWRNRLAKARTTDLLKRLSAKSK